MSLPTSASGGFFESGWEGRLCLQMGTKNNERAKVSPCAPLFPSLLSLVKMSLCAPLFPSLLSLAKMSLCAPLFSSLLSLVKMLPCAPLSHRSQRLDLGPCSQDGDLRIEASGGHGVVVAEKGVYAPPFCLVKTVDDGNRACLDVEREQVRGGARG
jgi:hypothetical protein